MPKKTSRFESYTNFIVKNKKEIFLIKFFMIFLLIFIAVLFTIIFSSGYVSSMVLLLVFLTGLFIPILLSLFVMIALLPGVCANVLAMGQLKERGWPMAGYMQAACARFYLGKSFDRIPPYEHIATTPVMAGKDFGESFWCLMEFTRDYWRERDAIKIRR